MPIVRRSTFGLGGEGNNSTAPPTRSTSGTTTLTPEVVETTANGSPKKSASKSAPRSPSKSGTKDKELPKSTALPQQYMTALSGNPLSSSQNLTQSLASNTSSTTVNATSSIDLNDRKAVWSLAMSLATAGKEDDAAMYFKIHEQLSASIATVSTAQVSVPAKRRAETLSSSTTIAADTAKSTDNLQLPEGAVIEGGIIFIPGAVTSHTDTGLPAFFQKNIRELSGLLPLTVFDKSWQNNANAYHHEKKFKNEESASVVNAWRGYPYPHEMTQSYADWSVNFDNFVYALKKVYSLPRMAACAEAHRSNVSFIRSQYNWMTVFRYDIAIRLNFFSHRVTVGGITSAIDISIRRDDIALNCYADVRRCDEGDFKDNPYAEGNCRHGYDWNTGLPKVKAGNSSNNNQATSNDSRNNGRHSNHRNNRRNNNYAHNNNNNLANANNPAENATVVTSNSKEGGGRTYTGRNFDPNYKAKKAAAAAAHQQSQNNA